MTATWAPNREPGLLRYSAVARLAVAVERAAAGTPRRVDRHAPRSPWETFRGMFVNLPATPEVWPIRASPRQCTTASSVRLGCENRRKCPQVATGRPVASFRRLCARARAGRQRRRPAGGVRGAPTVVVIGGTRWVSGTAARSRLRPVTALRRRRPGPDRPTGTDWPGAQTSCAKACVMFGHRTWRQGRRSPLWRHSCRAEQ